MELTFVTDTGHSFVVEIDPNMELENVMALLEAEASENTLLWNLSAHHTTQCLVRYTDKRTKYIL